MNKKMQLSLLAIMLGTLTACGGGGGSSDNKGSNINSPSASISYVRDDLKGQVRDAKSLVVRNKQNKTIIQTIHLADYPKGTIKETIKETDRTFTSYLRAVNLAYSGSVMFISNDPRFRMLSTNNKSMYVGLPTKYDSLPTGMMSYQGNSVGANTSGSLTLTADFNEKTVSGKIYNRTQDNGAKLPDIELRTSAIMRTPTDTGAGDGFGVGFRGNTASDGRSGRYDGLFMGPNAEEVIGKWSNNSSLSSSEVFAGERR